MRADWLKAARGEAPSSENSGVGPEGRARSQAVEPQVLGQLLVFAAELKELYRNLKRRTKELEDALFRLEQAYRSTVETMAFVVEFRDWGTRQHVERAARYAMAVARKLAPELAQDPALYYGFLLHDVGKVGVPDSLLGKTGPLDEMERAVMRTHTIIGAMIISGIPGLERIAPIIRHHHERWDGHGYPDGLKGEEIPLGARIFSVADAFDAMTTDRPYRKALDVQEALDELRRGAGTHFDPTVVETFISLVEEVGEE